MASKRKNRNGKKLLTAAEQIEVVLNAIRRAGGCLWTFFRSAAQALSARHFKPDREAAKFERVTKEGIHRHRGYKIPPVALAFAQQLLKPDEPQESHHAPKTVMRRAPAYA